MQDNDIVLKVNNLKTYFHTSHGVVKAVDGIDFIVKRGKTIGLVGESGCGKSVTSLSIMGLLPKSLAQIEDGEINFNGMDLTKMNEKSLRKLRGNEISMIFQEPMTSLNPVFTIGQQLSEPLKQHTKLNKSEMKKKIIDMLTLVGIPRPEGIYSEYPHQLSGGMRQRVMISLAMLCNPRLLIADEPTTALDVTIQAQILELIKEIRNKQDMSIILITHDLGVVAEMCDEVVIMYAGLIVEQADIKTIFDNPKHPYTQGLLNSRPGTNANERKQRLVSIPGSVPRPDELPPGCTFAARCPYVMEKCKTEKPPLYKLENQLSRCWLYEDESMRKERNLCLN
ncbi:ABC transporter ATP-binding protein [Sporosarcina psychrophila]|uniref:ABC transporter ATP-binding protein n=1 Tax=Sporosarcina psychrophila TaxID=1476 RepID=UPI00078C93FF|nr:ABC transporter ATP-binding protein [Sporosarcina psychrophila]AMQ04973.1 peptide ABC transporter ATP-binding protein [Sporosarcina psychrophila]